MRTLLCPAAFFVKSQLMLNRFILRHEIKFSAKRLDPQLIDLTRQSPRNIAFHKLIALVISFLIYYIFMSKRFDIKA